MDLSLGLGQRSRFLRRLKGLTQETFAAILPGANQATVARLEQGKLESVRFDILQALMRIAVDENVLLEWFFTGQGALTLTLPPDKHQAMRGVDVPPGVQLIVEEETEQTEHTNERAVTLTAATETLDNDAMDGIANNQGGGGE